MVTTIRRTTALAAVAAAVVATAPAGAQTPMPTLDVDHACYAPGDTITYHGTGYTPGGAVDLLLAVGQRFTPGPNTTAGPDGVLTGSLDAPDADVLLSGSQVQATVFLGAGDETRIDADTQPSDSQVGIATFTLSRWDVDYTSAGGRIKARKPITWDAFGWTEAAGKPLYLHYRFHGRTLKSTRLGRLGGPCGDLHVRMPRAFGPLRHYGAGRYKLVFNTDRHLASVGPSITWDVKVPRRDARP